MTLLLQFIATSAMVLDSNKTQPQSFMVEYKYKSCGKFSTQYF